MLIIIYLYILLIGHETRIHKSKCGFFPFPDNKNQIEQLIKAVGFFFSSKINQNTCITNGTGNAWSRKNSVQ